MSKEDNNKPDDTSRATESSFAGYIAKRRNVGVLGVFIIGVVILLFVLLGFFLFGRSHVPKQMTYTGCEGGAGAAAVGDARELFYKDVGYEDDFKSLVDIIESQTDYMSDGHCLGALSVYYARVGDYSKAEDLLSRLDSVSKEKELEYLSSADADYVRRLIDFNKQQGSVIQENIQSNTFINPEAQQ